MKKFEQQLLETGSLELICSYVEEHKETTSEKFQNALAEKVKIILQSFNFELSYSGGIPHISQSKEDILSMEVENFLDRFSDGYRNFPRSFFNQCEKLKITTAKDLLEFGRRNVLKMDKVGKVTVRMIDDAFVKVGIETF